MTAIACLIGQNSWLASCQAMKSNRADVHVRSGHQWLELFITLDLKPIFHQHFAAVNFAIKRVQIAAIEVAALKK